MDGPEITGRKQDGRFAPGQSGNQRGRPKGARNRATQAAETVLLDEAEALTRKCVEVALAGDVTALRLCLERILFRIKLKGIISVSDTEPTILSNKSPMACYK